MGLRLRKVLFLMLSPISSCHSEYSCVKKPWFRRSGNQLWLAWLPIIRNRAYVKSRTALRGVSRLYIGNLYSIYLPIGFLITGQHGHPSRNIQPQIEQDWQNRPLDEVYLILYIDAIHYSVRDNNVIRKLAAYIILGINTEGKKKFWLSVLVIMKVQNISFLLWTNWKTGDIKDVLAIYANGLTGIKEAIATAFPKTEYQCCIVHQVRNTLRYVPNKDRKTFITTWRSFIRHVTKRRFWQP